MSQPLPPNQPPQQQPRQVSLKDIMLDIEEGKTTPLRLLFGMQQQDINNLINSHNVMSNNLNNALQRIATLETAIAQLQGNSLSNPQLTKQAESKG